tara:strand:- start:620 stop:1018 length:399 start_codon:yes stop_codon:yes gene_type:complete
MSTLNVNGIKVSQIEDSLGNNGSSPSQIAIGRAKAWVSFDGTGSITKKSSHNVTSVSDEGTGIYKCSFATNFSDNNYCPVIYNNATTGAVGVTSFGNNFGGGIELAVDNIKVSSYGSSFTDSSFFSVVIFAS